LALLPVLLGIGLALLAVPTLIFGVALEAKEKDVLHAGSATQREGKSFAKCAECVRSDCPLEELENRRLFHNALISDNRRKFWECEGTLRERR